jgi:hypothetical protein
MEVSEDLTVAHGRLRDVDETPKRVDPEKLKVRIFRLQFDPHRLIYSSVILMTALAIYDPGPRTEGQSVLAVIIGVTLAPLFALTMAHVFSDALDLQIKLGRRLSGRDRRRLLFSNLEYMYIAVPPILLSIVLAFLGMDAVPVIDTVLWLMLASLFFWGVYAARAARLGGWAQLRFGFSYGVMGLIIVVIEIFLTH